MASIHLQGILVDSVGEIDVGGVITFTHLTTTGDTIASTQTELIIPPDGAYSIDVEYGQIRIDYTTRNTERFVANVIVNSASTATSLPELLSATTPVAKPIIIQMQGLVADATAAEAGAVAAAATTATRKDTFTNLIALSPTTDGSTFVCQERASAEYILKPSGYSALAGDATFANGRVAALQDTTKVEFFGVLTDVTNDVGVFNSALLRSRLDGNGSLYFNSKAYISTDLAIPIGVKLVGQHQYLDTTQRDWWPNLSSRIRLEPTATITTANASGLKNCLVYRADMTFPVAGLTVTEVALYAGTAVTVSNAAPYIGYNTFLGFEWAVETIATNTPRGRLEWNNVDCTNGFNVDLDLGGFTFAYNFCQPILSNSDVDNIRTGVGFNIVNKSDWTTLIGNFVFQDIGYRVNDANSVKFIACMADHPTESGVDTYNTGDGFQVLGASTDIIITSCQTASHENGIVVQVNDGNEVSVSGTNMWNMNSVTGIGYKVNQGNLSVSGGICGRFASSGGKAMVVNNANSNVHVSGGAIFKNVSVGFDTISFNEFTVAQDTIIRSVPIVRNNEAIKSTASAGTFTPLANQGLQSISGTVTIGTVVGAGVIPEKIITFIITDGLTLNHGNMLLNGAVNWVAPAGSSITLQYITGNTWREISRNEQ